MGRYKIRRKTKRTIGSLQSRKDDEEHEQQQHCKIGEDADYDRVIARYKAEKLADATKDMKIVAVNFNAEHEAMLGHCKMILENEPNQFEKWRYIDTINVYNSIIEEFQKLYEQTPSTQRFARARISGMKQPK